MHFQGVSLFGSQLALTLATNITMAGISLISGILLARVLGPRGRGELAAIQTWPTILATLAMIGIPEALVYYSARGKYNAGQYLTTGILISLVMCIPIGIISYIVLPYLLAAQSAQVIGFARIYLWILPITAIVGMMVHPLRGRSDLVYWNLLRVLPTLVWISVIILLLLGIGGLPQSALPEYFSKIYLVGLAILLLPFSLVISKRLQHSFKPSLSLVKPLLIFGLPIALSNLPTVFNLRLDQLLLGTFFEPRLLGLYVVAVSWGNMISPIISAFTSVVLPKIAGSTTINTQVDAFAQISRLGVFLCLFLGMIGGFLAPVVFPILFGHDYVNALPIAMILAVAAGIFGYNQVLEAGAMGLGQPRFVLIAEFIGLAVTFLSLGLLLRPFQLIGAAIASIISYLVVTIILILLLSHLTRLGYKELLLPKLKDVINLIQRLRQLLNHS